MITIILGMHRSGTSTIAGILHLNKIIMGTYQNFWPRPLRQNPKGFYENYDFRKINDQLLKQVGYDVKSYNPNIPTLEPTNKILDKMEKIIIKNDSTYSNWGWKDPRTCLTINSWSRIINDLGLQSNLKIIFLVRKGKRIKYPAHINFLEESIYSLIKK